MKSIVNGYKRAKTWLMIASVALIGTFTLISLPDSVQAEDYVFSEVEDKIYNTLRAEGYTKAAACGILGNMSVENSGFEADLYGNKGVTYGLCQWNNVGDRLDTLFKWCKNRKLDAASCEGQIAFVMYELEGGDPIAKRLEKFLKSTENARDAAMEFAVGFERCVGASPHPENDAKYEGSIFPEYYGKTYQALGKRMAMAEKYYEGFDTHEENSTLVFEIDVSPTPGLVFELEERAQEDFEKSLGLDLFRALDEHEIAVARTECCIIGYLCGCLYLFLIFADRNKLKNHGLKNVTEIPHARTMMAHFGVKKASYVVINDIFKLFLAIGLTMPIVKGIPFDEKILYTGLGVIIGNACPFWNKFRGGLGFTVTILTLILYTPIWGIGCCIIGLLFATLLQSLTVGITIMSILMVPAVYNFRDPSEAIVVAIIMLSVIISHQRVLLRYFDRKVLRNHYMNRRKRRLRPQT